MKTFEAVSSATMRNGAGMDSNHRSSLARRCPASAGTQGVEALAARAQIGRDLEQRHDDEGALGAGAGCGSVSSPLSTSPTSP